MIYLDGVPLASRGRLLAETGGRRSPEAMINLVVGRDDAMPHRFGNGWLDEIAVYDRALPPERVRLRHALGTGKRQP